MAKLPEAANKGRGRSDRKNFACAVISALSGSEQRSERIPL
jgi:hypothetical protein